MSHEFEVSQGATPRIQATFTVASVATDPTTITLKVKEPGVALATYTYAGGGLTKGSTGVYYRDTLLNVPGEVICQFSSTGTAAGLAEFTISVEASRL